MFKVFLLIFCACLVGCKSIVDPYSAEKSKIDAIIKNNQWEETYPDKTLLSSFLEVYGYSKESIQIPSLRIYFSKPKFDNYNITFWVRAEITIFDERNNKFGNGLSLQKTTVSCKGAHSDTIAFYMHLHTLDENDEKMIIKTKDIAISKPGYWEIQTYVSNSDGLHMQQYHPGATQAELERFNQKKYQICSMANY